MPSPLSVKKNNYIKNPKRSDIETPPKVAQFISDLFPNVSFVFDPCKGNGNLLKPFAQRGCVTNGLDIKDGVDFLSITYDVYCDLVVCNPPFNLGVGKKLGSELFLEKILEVCSKNVPIVLFVPMGFRLNQRKSSSRYRKIRDVYPPITSIVSLPLDIFQDVLFHNEILIFNAPNLKPHYCLDIQYLHQ